MLNNDIKLSLSNKYTLICDLILTKNVIIDFRLCIIYLFNYMYIKIFFEFKNIYNIFMIQNYRFLFIFWFMLNRIPSIYGFNRIFHIGTHYYSFFIGLNLYKFSSVDFLFLLSYSLFPMIGSYGWIYWIFSKKHSTSVICLSNLDIFGELTGHSGFYNVHKKLYIKLSTLNLGNNYLVSFLNCFKIFIN